MKRQTPPDQPGRAAGQNPDVKEQPRTPHEKPHRPSAGGPQAGLAELGVPFNIYTYMSSKIIVKQRSAVEGDRTFGSGLKNGFNDGLVQRVFDCDLIWNDAGFNQCLKQGVKPFTGRLNGAWFNNRMPARFLNEAVV